MCLAAYNYSRSIGVTAARRLPKPEARVRPPYTAPEKNNPSSGVAKNIPDSAEYLKDGAETKALRAEAVSVLREVILIRAAEMAREMAVATDIILPRKRRKEMTSVEVRSLPTM